MRSERNLLCLVRLSLPDFVSYRFISFLVAGNALSPISFPCAGWEKLNWCADLVSLPNGASFYFMDQPMRRLHVNCSFNRARDEGTTLVCTSTPGGWFFLHSLLHFALQYALASRLTLFYSLSSSYFMMPLLPLPAWMRKSNSSTI